MGTLKFACACGQETEVPEEQLGKEWQCVKCGERTKCTTANTRPSAHPDAFAGTSVPKARSGQADGLASERHIAKLLVEGELITKEQAHEALSLQQEEGGKIFEKLHSLGFLDTTSFVNFLARQPGIGSIDLACCEVSMSLVALVPRELAQRHQVFPIDRFGKTLTVAMVCPLDEPALQELQEVTELRVKPLLCKASDIQQAIRRYYPEEQEVGSEPLRPRKSIHELEGPIRLQNVAQLVRQIDSLPTLPETVERVRRLMSNPDSSTREVAEIAAGDPPVVAKTLSIVNSAAYGLPEPTSDFNLAVSLLGLREMYSIVMSVAVIDMFSGSQHFDYEAFWQEALRCAQASRLIAKSCGGEDPVGAFSAGLLHDIGRIALAEVVPEPYAEIRKSARGAELIEAEETTLGLSHTEAGYELAAHWALPVEISVSIRHHHNPTLAPEGQKTSAIVAIADAMVYASDMGAESHEAFLAETRELLPLVCLDETCADTMLDVFCASQDREFLALVS